MTIKQDIIKTEGVKQGEPTNNLSLIYAFPEGGVYVPVKQGEHYFLVAFDGPPITKNVPIGIGTQSTEYDMYGNELSTDIDVQEVKIEYIKRSFYIFKTLNGNVQEQEEIAFINVQTNGPTISPPSLNIDKVQTINSTFVEKYIKNVYSLENNPKNYLTLKKKTKIKAVASSLESFENLCDIILAETIKSYLL